MDFDPEESEGMPEDDSGGANPSVKESPKADIESNNSSFEESSVNSFASSNLSRMIPGKIIIAEDQLHNITVIK